MLSDALERALEDRDADVLDALASREPDDERDALLVLSTVYDLWMSPLWEVDGREDFQCHPAIMGLKWRLEQELVRSLRARSGGSGVPSGGAVAAMRRIATADLVPEIYSWVAQRASWDELMRFLSLEGGPDSGFDDLVAFAQVGLHDGPKVALAANYWDELGRGSLESVHTVLHDQLVAAVEMPRTPRSELPVGSLERAALGGLLATNRRLQPEMLGALGLIELQAGPRCRAVLKALTRLGAPAGAFPFYEEHAHADPVHGNTWLQEVIAPLATSQPSWAPRMVEGARWRDLVNRRFLEEMQEALAPHAPSARMRTSDISPRADMDDEQTACG